MGSALVPLLPKRQCCRPFVVVRRTRAKGEANCTSPAIKAVSASLLPRNGTATVLIPKAGEKQLGSEMSDAPETRRPVIELPRILFGVLNECGQRFDWKRSRDGQHMTELVHRCYADKRLPAQCEWKLFANFANSIGIGLPNRRVCPSAAAFATSLLPQPHRRLDCPRRRAHETTLKRVPNHSRRCVDRSARPKTER